MENSVENENNQRFYCEDDKISRIYCVICDEHAFYKNYKKKHLKPLTHVKKFYRVRLKTKSIK